MFNPLSLPNSPNLNNVGELLIWSVMIGLERLTDDGLIIAMNYPNSWMHEAIVTNMEFYETKLSRLREGEIWFGM